MSSTIEFRRPDGETAPGYLAQAEQPHAPGIVFFEEWWGLDDRVKATADRLASHGFEVLVPDLYRGRSAATGDEANHLMQGLDFKDAATQDASGAARYLRERGAKRVGVIGFCMGGALAMLSVMHGREFDAASIWYGYPPVEAGDPANISVPLQGHWALDDEFFKIDGSTPSNASSKAPAPPLNFTATTRSTGFLTPANPARAALDITIRSTPRLRGAAP